MKKFLAILFILALLAPVTASGQWVRVFGGHGTHAKTQ